MNARSLRLLPTHPDTTYAGSGTTLIDRYAGRNDHATCLHYVVPHGSPAQTDLHLMLVDTSLIEDGILPLGPDHMETIWHLLWVRDESGATARVASRTGTSTWPIAPGDSLSIPAQAPLHTTGGQLGIAVSTPAESSDSPLLPPTHGIDDFDGHNRRTTYRLLTTPATYRWKITDPLVLSAFHDGPVIIYSLAGDPAIATPTENLTLRRGQAVLADPLRPITIYPAGLGYIFTIGV